MEQPDFFFSSSVVAATDFAVDDASISPIFFSNSASSWNFNVLSPR